MDPASRRPCRGVAHGAWSPVACATVISEAPPAPADLAPESENLALGSIETPSRRFGDTHRDARKIPPRCRADCPRRGKRRAGRNTRAPCPKKARSRYRSRSAPEACIRRAAQPAAGSGIRGRGRGLSPRGKTPRRAASTVPQRRSGNRFQNPSRGARPKDTSRSAGFACFETTRSAPGRPRPCSADRR